MARKAAGEIVFVTGASSGFGAAIARLYVDAGARVIAAARRADRLERVARELGQSLLPLALDVTDPVAVRCAFEDLPEPFAAVSILVNNAGLGVDRGPAMTARLEDWTEMVNVNVMGVLHCTHAALPGMLARGRGHIVSISSIAAGASAPGSVVYGATKAFVSRFSKSLKSDLIATPVRCSVVAPGAAETEFWSVRWEGDETRARAAYSGYKALQAEDVAEAVLYATSAPLHVDVTEIELMPHAQGYGPRIFAREG